MKPSIVTRLRSHAVRGGWLAVLVLGTGLVLGALAPAAEAVTDLLPSAWPMYGYDPKHTFRSPLPGPTTGNFRTATPVGNIIYSQAVVTLDGVIVFSSGFGTFGLRPNGTLW